MRRVLLAAPLSLLYLASPSTVAAQPWPVAPASDSAEVISQLFWFTLVLAVIVFVLVEGLLIYSSLRFRRRTPLPLHEPPQIHGNTRLEVMWATVPALMLIGLFGITVSRLGDLNQMPTDPNTMRVSVTGRQFQWEFAYGDSGVKTINDLHIPTGTPLIFDVTSVDVIHSFWVPNLYGKIDANPGRVNHITFKAKQPGEYRGVCAELCGAGHAGMQFRVTAVTQSEFQDWLQQQQQGGQAPPPAAPASAAAASPEVATAPAVAAASPAPAAPVGQPAASSAADVQAGAALIQRKGCGGCHVAPGVPGAAGQVGPSLAGVASRTRIAGGAVPNTGPDDLKQWIMNPPAVKPATTMPNLGLTDDEATKIVAYLETLK
jgi:cytochrome c oxidase subunit 2